MACFRLLHDDDDDDVISPDSVALGSYYVKVVEDTPIHSASEV